MPIHASISDNQDDQPKHDFSLAQRRCVGRREVLLGKHYTMNTYDFDLVVIGGGSGGVTAPIKGIVGGETGGVFRTGSLGAPKNCVCSF